MFHNISHPLEPKNQQKILRTHFSKKKIYEGKISKIAFWPKKIEGIILVLGHTKLGVPQAL